MGGGAVRGEGGVWRKLVGVGREQERQLEEAVGVSWGHGIWGDGREESGRAGQEPECGEYSTNAVLRGPASWSRGLVGRCGG